jgi:hypothetical protein
MILTIVACRKLSTITADAQTTFSGRIAIFSGLPFAITGVIRSGNVNISIGFFYSAPGATAKTSIIICVSVASARSFAFSRRTAIFIAIADTTTAFALSAIIFFTYITIFTG